jgi:hypothetical protein
MNGHATNGAGAVKLRTSVSPLKWRESDRHLLRHDGRLGDGSGLGFSVEPVVFPRLP